MCLDHVFFIIDGKWNGMVGMLIRDQCDLVASPLTQTMQRDAVIDFTIPLDQVGKYHPIQ